MQLGSVRVNNMNDTRPKRRIVKALRNGFAIGISLAILLIFVEVVTHASRKNIFDRIGLGMTEASVKQILIQDGIYCETSRPEYRCIFDDLWKVYEVRFSEQGFVVRKHFAYKPPSPLMRLSRFLERE